MKLKRILNKTLLALAVITASQPVFSQELSAFGFKNGSKVEFKLNDVIATFDKRVFSEQGLPGISRHPFEKDRYILTFDSRSKARVKEMFTKAYYLALKLQINKLTGGAGFEMLESPDVSSQIDTVGVGKYRSLDGVDIIYIGDDIGTRAMELSVDYRTAYQFEALSRASFDYLSKEHKGHLSRANADMLSAFYLIALSGLERFDDIFLYKSADTFITHEPNAHSLSGWKVRVAASFASRFMDSKYTIRDLAHNEELASAIIDRMLENKAINISSETIVDFELLNEQLKHYWEIAIVNLAKRELVYDKSGCLSPYGISNGNDILEMISKNASSETLCKVGNAINSRGLKESTISELAGDTLARFIVKDGSSYLMVSPATRDFLTMFDNTYNVRIDDILN